MKDTDELYNIDEYQTVDSENHGTLDDIKKEFIQNGFKLESCDFNKRPFNDSSTYLAFLKLSKSQISTNRISIEDKKLKAFQMDIIQILCKE